MKNILKTFLEDVKEEIIDPGGKHYITISRLEPGGVKMDLGRFSVYLYETDELPLHTADEPRPLL